jgi:hypothetical protein
MRDGLRPPSLLDGQREAYKDWLHLNLLDPASGVIGLVNVSLHGAPGDPRARAVGTALVHSPTHGWIGNVEVGGLGDANIGPGSVALANVAIAVDHGAERAYASVRMPDDGLSLSLAGQFAAPAIDIEQRIPLGPGWISWFVVPRLGVDGELVIAGERIDLGKASAYHDHNWGRWRWGDDLGWEWGAFLAPAPGPAFVLSRATDRDHRRRGPPMLTVDAPGLRRRFPSASVRHVYEGRWSGRLRRLPGALAALLTDRAAPRLPARVVVDANDGIDRVHLEFEARAAAQLIAADPTGAGYGFIHELVGEFHYSGRLDGADVGGSGLAVVEHAD